MKGKISRGKGFAGAVGYVLEKEGAELLGGTMSGTDKQTMVREFAVTKALRPEAKNPVWHCSLSAAPGETKSSEKWQEISADFMQRMGHNLDTTQYILVRHTDTDHDHVHIVASRIGLDGKLWAGRHDVKQMIKHTQELEKEHGLRLTPGLDYDEQHKAGLSRGEIEKSIKTGEAPAKLVLQGAIDQALSDKPTTAAFIERLQAAGIQPRPNIASTGRMNGFSFELDGVAFKASSLGKAYSWNQLQQRGLDYEQTRDSESLGSTAQQSNRRANPRAEAAPGEQRGEPSAADRAPRQEPSSAQRREQINDSANRQNGGAAAEQEREADQGRSPGSERGAARAQRSDKRLAASNIHDKKAQQERVAQGLDSSDQHERTNSAGAGDRIHSLAAPAFSSRQKRDQVLQGDQPGKSAANSENRQREQPVAAHIVAKQHAWQQQHEALQAPAYRLTLTARRENLQTYNWGKGKAPGGGEKLYSAEEVRDMIPQLSRQNARGYDIYITPLSEQQHYIVLDDSDKQRLEQMHQRTGIAPCLIQESSPGNLQAVIIADKVQGQHEQSNANYLVQGLNKAYGDPKFTGVIHPFRLSGFMNQKPVYEQNNRRPIVRPRPVLTCRPGADLVLNRMLEKQREQQAEQQQRQKVQERTQRIESFNEHSKRGVDERYKELAQHYCKYVDSKGWERDWSRIDYAIAGEMLKQDYYSENQIASAIKDNSPGIDERKQDPAYYARQTVAKAAESPEVRQHLELERERTLVEKLRASQKELPQNPSQQPKPSLVQQLKKSSDPADPAEPEPQRKRKSGSSFRC